MAGKVKGRRLDEHGVPAAPQLVDAEITQSRDLGIDLLAVQRRWTDPQAGHHLQAERRFGRGRREPVLRPPAAPVIRYTLTPSTLSESSVSLRRFRTTPARKPRNECCCQPVAFIIASMVAPLGDCSTAITRACFEPETAFRDL